MKIKLIVIFALVFSFMACENQSNEFEDFGSTSVYFPYQTPVRTLVLGDYDLGFNDNDNNGRFEIGVVMSGVYENTIDRKVYFELAPELIDPVAIGVDSVNVKILPSSYYTIEQESPVTISAGAFNGRIPIQLNDAFFDDPLSFAEFGEAHYVVPLKITDYEQIDSLLTGVPIIENPIKIISEHWNPAPKDYTLFGIKYINKYHGIHLRRGQDKIQGSIELHTIASGDRVTSTIDEVSVYRAEFVVEDEVVPVVTSGRNEVDVDNRVRRGDTIPSGNKDIALNLVINENGDITISNAVGETRVVTGSGKWLESGDEWGGKKRNVIYLEYEYEDVEIFPYETSRGRTTVEASVNFLHQVKDTLVMRNRDIKFEEFIVELKE
tara:strand:- start:53999 stop:55138 length:1140 start_codon:yes stop_codon:yes gene_type:complete